jgi:hypothetical protein
LRVVEAVVMMRRRDLQSSGEVPDSGRVAVSVASKVVMAVLQLATPTTSVLAAHTARMPIRTLQITTAADHARTQALTDQLCSSRS